MQNPTVEAELDETRELLRVSEEHFRLLVESVRDYAIFLLDPRGRVASWNGGAERIKGYGASDIIGHHFSEFYPPEDIAAGKCEMELDVASRVGRFEDEGWRKRKDGTYFWANVVITALRDEKTGALVGFAKVTRDLTERRRAEDERIRLAEERKAREASETANRAKDDFIAHVSHELRTPLNAILGWARLLSSGLDETRREQATKTIERNADAMRQLIDDLLDVSRIISGKMRLQVEPVDLALVIERGLDAVKLAAEAKTIRLTTNIDGETAAIRGDAGRLQQVVWNLLSNAVKFTDRGGRVTLGLHVDRENDSAVIEVEDSGVGIAPASLPLVFDTFWQDASGPSRGGRGLGLGLAISRKIVELHGGHIEAASEGLGRGARFRVVLPLSSEPVERVTEAAPPARDTPKEQLPRLDGVRVLVVEDEADARDLLRLVLQMCGADVRTAGSVGEALAAFEEQVPDVLLSDIGLPGRDGYDLIRKVRARTADAGGLVPAAAMTAFARSEDRVRALAAGFVMHIAKPVEPTEVAMIVAALASNRPRR
ncbi:MAG: PAS domain S-box protein [Deltaproteobacteria bacterium]|nr:PAS domain S-box protein [Deltaproteobacteria bacterium]